VSHGGIVPAYEAVVEALRETGLRFAFIGALAAIEWGRPRATDDVDLVVSVEASDWPKLETALRARSLTPGRGVGPAEGSDPLPDIAIFWSAQVPAVRVDLFVAKTDFERAVLDGARLTSIAGIEVPVASPEAVIVYKLLAARSKDLIDLESIFEARSRAQVTLDWPFIDHWAAEWAIEDRLAPFRARFGPASK